MNWRLLGCMVAAWGILYHLLAFRCPFCKSKYFCRCREK